MAKLTRKQFEAKLAEFPGVTWDRESEQADNLQLDAPVGQRFNYNGCHTLVIPFANNGGQSWKPEAYAEAIVAVQAGLYPCDGGIECEVCES